MDTKKSLTIGSFDFLKGVSIMLVLIGHTEGWFSLGNSTINHIMGMIGSAGIVCLFMCAGFGLRKSSIKLSIKKEIDKNLKTYLKIAVISIFLFFIFDYLCEKNMHDTLIDTKRTILGYVIGQSFTKTLFGNPVYAGGAMWFVVTSAFSSVIVCSMLYYFKNNTHKYIIFGLLIIGIGLTNLDDMLPFCIVQTLFCTFYVYSGYFIKSKKLLTVRLPYWSYAIFILSFILTFNLTYSIAECGYKYAIIAVPALTVFAFFIIRFCLYVNSYSNSVIDLIDKIGNLSIYILCIHSIEQSALPWKHIVNKIYFSDYRGFIIALFIRVTSIAIGFAILYLYKKLKPLYSKLKIIVKKPDFKRNIIKISIITSIVLSIFMCFYYIDRKILFSKIEITLSNLPDNYQTECTAEFNDLLNTFGGNNSRHKTNSQLKAINKKIAEMISTGECFFVKPD